VATGGVVERPSALRIRRLWPVAAAGLIAMYAGQELLEGALSSGHPDGVAGVFGAGGWVALPLAVVLGGVVALAVGVARTLEERAVPGIAVPRALAAPTDWRTPARRCRPKGRLLATHLAGRSPPQFSVVP
jgi:hypothetical protein